MLGIDMPDDTAQHPDPPRSGWHAIYNSAEPDVQVYGITEKGNRPVWQSIDRPAGRAGCLAKPSATVMGPDVDPTGWKAN
jgi:hypothetical protein